MAHTDRAELLIFGPNREGVVGHAEEIKQLCVDTGSEFHGPTPEPQICIEEAHPAFTDPDGELFGEPPSDEEQATLPDREIFRRRLRIINNSEVIKEAVSMIPPDDVFLRATLDTVFSGGGGSNSAFSYDSNDDYVTEL